MQWWKLVETLATMYVGTLLASLVGSRPECVRTLIRPLKPLVGGGRLGRAAVLSVLSSSVAMYAARDSAKGLRDVSSFLLLLAFPASLAAAVQFYLPVVAPLVGPACLILVAISMVSALITSLIGRILSDDEGGGDAPRDLRLVRRPLRTANRVFLRVAPPVMAAVLAFHWCEREHLLDPLISRLAPLATSFNLPPAASLVVLGCLVNVAVGAAVGAELMERGKLDWWSVAMALSLGRALSLFRIHAQFLAPPALSFFGGLGAAGVALRTLVETGANVAVVWALSQAPRLLPLHHLPA